MAALEDNLRKVYSVVAMEGGVHMNSIGPAIESQLDSIPLRCAFNPGVHALLFFDHFVYVLPGTCQQSRLLCSCVNPSRVDREKVCAKKSDAPVYHKPHCVLELQQFFFFIP